MVCGRLGRGAGDAALGRVDVGAWVDEWVGCWVVARATRWVGGWVGGWQGRTAHSFVCPFTHGVGLGRTTTHWPATPQPLHCRTLRCRETSTPLVLLEDASERSGSRSRLDEEGDLSGGLRRGFKETGDMGRGVLLPLRG